MSKYKYWGHRLRAIDESFKHASPNTFRQWLKDSRNGPQRWSIAIATLAVILTCLLGIAQLVATWVAR